MITDIQLRQFRSYKSGAFEFGEGVNIIVGPNASGKTNLLEAVQIICLGGSYRARDRELIKFGSSWSRLDVHTKDGSRSVKLEFIGESAQKSFEINERIYKRLPFDKTIPVVVFEPEDLQLLRGEPQKRRDFLDDLLEQTTPGYRMLRNQYRRTLAQRNKLLKKGYEQARQQVFAWDLRLSELGERMTHHRNDLAMQLNEGIGKLYRQLSRSRAQVELAYNGANKPTNYASQMLKKLEAELMEDCRKGFTSYGPHRDDLTVAINTHKTQESASRGEIRTLLLALKILELRLLESIRGQKPLLLLDDVFSELDGKRRQALTKFLSKYQTFITTTDADVVVQHFMDDCTIIPITK